MTISNQNKKGLYMNNSQKTVVDILILIFRLIFGAVFIFSGFVKLIDPLGFTYKIQDYLTAFGPFFENFSFLALPTSILLCTLELLIGLCLVFKVQYRLATLFGLLFMAVMTPLTLYIAIANPVSDCGCFGDAIVISNTETFVKNIFLFAMIIFLFITRKRVHPMFVKSIDWTLFVLFIAIGVSFAIYNYRHLPLIDFRPYKIGVNIRESMEIPDGFPKDEYKITFIYEKDGQQKEFTLDDYPKDDSTWVFVDQKSLLISKGYEPPIHDFTIEDEYGDNILDEVLDYEGYTYLVITYDISKAKDKNLENLQKLYDKTLESNYQMYVLTASSDDDIENLRERTGITYPFYKSDPTTLKTIIRSNPGILLLNNGIIEDKWAWRDFEW